MKTRNIFIAALAASALFFSCEKPEPDGPDGPAGPEIPEVVVTFPELVTDFEVKPGSTLTLKFTPAKDWSLSVPSENLQWFWIADGSFKVDKLNGKASEKEVTVTIGVSETEEFDTNRSCDVTLAIGDESKVIAQYMRPAKERTLAVYLADGTEEVDAVTVDWSAEDADFRATLRVESNYEWTVAYPEWLTVNVPEKTVGVTDLLITGESLEEVNGKLEFKAGDQTIKEITVTLPSCKGMDIYSAQVENEEFKYADEGGYLWTEEAVEEVKLEWLGSDFRMPVKISAKCEWTVEFPQWLTAELPEKTAGEIILTLMGVPSKYPLDDTSDKIVFKSGETVIHEIKVTIPGCKDMMSYSLGMALTELEFNAAGEVMTSTGYADVDVTASVFGTSKVDVKVFEKVAGKYVIDKAVEWVDVTVSAFDTASDAPVLQDRDVKISVTENTSGDREAVLIFVPHSLEGNAQAVFTDDKTAVKEEYKQYAVNVTQLSNKFVITMNSTAEAMEEAGVTFEEASAEKKTALAAAFGETDQIYVLTYDDIYALDAAHMSMTRTYASVKVFDADKTDQSAVEDFWLAFTGVEANNAGVIEMYFNTDPENLPKLPTTPSTGYVVFYDADDTVLAIIECVSPWKEEEIVTPPEPDQPGDGTIKDEEGNVYSVNTTYFTNPDAAAAMGAIMYEYTAGPIFDMYSEYYCPVLKLVYTDPETILELNVSKDIFNFTVNPYENENMITVDGKDMYNDAGFLWEWNDKKHTYVGPYDGTAEIAMHFTESDSATLLFYKQSAGIPVLVIICELDLN